MSTPPRRRPRRPRRGGASPPRMPVRVVRNAPPPTAATAFDRRADSSAVRACRSRLDSRGGGPREPNDEQRRHPAEYRDHVALSSFRCRASLAVGAVGPVARARRVCPAPPAVVSRRSFPVRVRPVAVCARPGQASDAGWRSTAVVAGLALGFRKPRLPASRCAPNASCPPRKPRPSRCHRSPEPRQTHVFDRQQPGAAPVGFASRGAVATELMTAVQSAGGAARVQAALSSRVAAPDHRSGSPSGLTARGALPPKPPTARPNATGCRTWGPNFPTCSVLAEWSGRAGHA